MRRHQLSITTEGLLKVETPIDGHIHTFAVTDQWGEDTRITCRDQCRVLLCQIHDSFKPWKEGDELEFKQRNWLFRVIGVYIYDVSPGSELVCKWFAGCNEPSVKNVNHPVLGKVPACQRCIDRLELT